MPFYTYKSERTALSQIAAKREAVDKNAESAARDPSMWKPQGGIHAYWEKNNMKSLDGLTGLSLAHQHSFKFSGYAGDSASDLPSPGEAKPTVHVTKALGLTLLDLADKRLLFGLLIGAVISSLCFRLIQVD